MDTSGLKVNGFGMEEIIIGEMATGHIPWEDIGGCREIGDTEARDGIGARVVGGDDQDKYSEANLSFR